MIPATCVFLGWDALPFGVQLARNLAALLPGHAMHVSSDWANARIEATVRNRQRIYLYERARWKRIQVYQDKVAKRAARGGGPARQFLVARAN